MDQDQSDHLSSETLTIGEAAALLKLGLDSTKSLIASGEIPAFSLNRKHWVLLKQDVLAYIAKQSRAQQHERWLRSSAAVEVIAEQRRRGRRARPLPTLQDLPDL